MDDDESWTEVDDDGPAYESPLTDEQKERLAELSKVLGKMKPASARDVSHIYARYELTLAADWLKWIASFDVAEEFLRTLSDVKQRFHALDYKAKELLEANRFEHDELGSALTFPSYRLTWTIGRRISEASSDPFEPCADPNESETQFLDDYNRLHQQFVDVARYLRRVSVLARSKLASKRAAEPVQGDVAPAVEIGDGHVPETTTRIEAVKLDPPAIVLTETAKEILALLQKTGFRLTTTQILSELNKESAAAESTIKNTLAELTRNGILNNRSDTKPRGYGIPDWPA